MPAGRFGHPATDDTLLPSQVALRWVIEHKSCTDFPKCWAAAPRFVKKEIERAWGGDPWPSK